MVSIVRACSFLLAVVLSVEAAFDINWTDDCTAPPIPTKDSYWLNDIWYTIQVSKGTKYPEGSQKCIMNNFVLLQQDNGFSLANLAWSTANNSLIYRSYYARIATPSKVPAILHFEPYYTRDVSRNTIVATDYRNYVVIVKCQPDQDKDLVQVMSKTTELSLAKKNEVRDKLHDAGYSPNDLVDINQNDC